MNDGVYNVSQLADGTNIVHWLLVVNSWTNGTLGIAIIVGGCAISFAVARWFQVETEDALAGACFIWGLIAGFVWLLTWNDLRAIPTLLPILLFVLCAISIFGKAIRGFNQQT